MKIKHDSKPLKALIVVAVDSKYSTSVSCYIVVVIIILIDSLCP